MLFSYYFDTQKTHLLNCRFRVLQFTEKAAGVIEIMFSAEITERLNGIARKKETKVQTFSFPPTIEGQTRHDIDFTRVRFSDQKKWIFTVINNKDNNQKASVGLISSLSNKNPLGMDIYHDDAEFNVELKANNLSILESTYVPPVLTQTLVSTGFEQPGYPERFSSYTANYDGMALNYSVKDFRQDFLESIPTDTPFKIELDIAPQVVTPKSGEKIFDLVIPYLGRISLLKTGLEYLIHDGMSSDAARVFFEAPVQPSDFYANNVMSTKARMKIEGDGLGKITVTYNNKTITSVYDHKQEFSYLDFRGAYAGAIL